MCWRLLTQGGDDRTQRPRFTLPRLRGRSSSLLKRYSSIPYRTEIAGNNQMQVSFL